MEVAIVTDTVACLPQDIVVQYNIAVVPLEVIYEGKTYFDSVDITPARFYEILKTSNVLPTTTAPSPEAYLKIYEKFAGESKDILVVCPSTKLTHVYESSRVAAEMLRERPCKISIEVLDTGTAAGAQGFIALDAAKAAEKGLSLNEVLSIAHESMKWTHVIVFLDTLEYLARSGRVSHLLAWANALLRIKPVIELLPLSGGVVPVGRVRTRPRAMMRIIEILKERSGDRPLRVFVQHTNAEEEAIILARQIQSEIDCEALYVKDFTPVMGVHTGPGLVGVAYSTYRSPV